MVECVRSTNCRREPNLAMLRVCATLPSNDHATAVLQNSGFIHLQVSVCTIGCSGKVWKRDEEVIGREDVVDVGSKRDERDEVCREYQSVWGAIGFSEKDNGQVLDCCVDD
jgi:hypothetical protein